MNYAFYLFSAHPGRYGIILPSCVIETFSKLSKFDKYSCTTVTNGTVYVSVRSEAVCIKTLLITKNEK